MRSSSRWRAPEAPRPRDSRGGFFAPAEGLCYAAPMTPWLRALPLFALGLGLGAGCMTNTIELETDPGTDEDSGGDPSTSGSGGLDTTPTSGPMDDTVTTPGPQLLLFAFNSALAPGVPFQGIVDLTPGTGTVDLTLQWLSLDIGSTTSPRQPVGDVYAYPGLPVDASGTFYWDTGIILIPAAANPVSGEDLVASIQANVVPLGVPAYCGVAGGTVTSPVQVPLDGSTHAMTEVPGVTNLPTDFAVACP